MTPDWSAARAAMLLDPTVINLNTGSFGPTPRVVFERATDLRRQLAAEPMDFLLRQSPPLLWEARERPAKSCSAITSTARCTGAGSGPPSAKS